MNQRGNADPGVTFALLIVVAIIVGLILTATHSFNVASPAAPTSEIQAACDKETASLHAALSEASKREIKEFVVAEAIGAAVGAVASKASGGKALDGAAIGATAAGTAEVLTGNDHGVSQKRTAFRAAYKACIERHRTGPPK